MSHPFQEGGLIAWELNRDIRAHVLRAQKPSVDATDKLSEEENKRLNEARDDAERSRIWAELVIPKLKKSDMVQGAVDFLGSLEPERMMSLFDRLVRYTNVDGSSLANPTHRDTVMDYRSMVPLMAAIIQHNDFLDLDASALLQIQA